MGVELVRIVGVDDFYVITCDRRISRIGSSLRRLKASDKEQYGIPQRMKFSKTLNLHITEIQMLPRVFGQKVSLPS